MLEINDKQTIVHFGIGDVCIAPIQTADNENCLGFCNQAPREIGSVGDYLEDDEVELEWFPVILKFDKPECIDVLIRALGNVKEQFAT